MAARQGARHPPVAASNGSRAGSTIEDTIETARQLKALGCDFIDASSGGNAPHQKIPLGPGYQVPFAARIRKEVGIKTWAVGLITEPEQAERIVAAGEADCTVHARPFLLDPRWAWNAARALGVEPPPLAAAGGARQHHPAVQAAAHTGEGGGLASSRIGVDHGLKWRWFLRMAKLVASGVVLAIVVIEIQLALGFRLADTPLFRYPWPAVGLIVAALAFAAYNIWTTTTGAWASVGIAAFAVAVMPFNALLEPAPPPIPVDFWNGGGACGSNAP